MRRVDVVAWRELWSWRFREGVDGEDERSIGWCAGVSRCCPTRSASRISARCWCASRALPRARSACDRLAVRHHPRRHLQPAAPDRHRHPASAALCAGEFRPDRHHRLDRLAVLGDPNAPLQFPAVNRKSKRDSLLARPREPLPPLPPLVAIEPVPQAQADAPLKSDEAEAASILTRNTNSPRLPDEQLAPPDIDLPYVDIRRRLTELRRRRQGRRRIYFGADPLAAGQEAITPWAPGEAPVVMASGDPDIKQSALAPPQPAATTKPAKPSPAKAKSPASSSGRNRRRSGWRSPARRSPRRRNVSPTRSISKRAANRCAGRSRSRRW